MSQIKTALLIKNMKEFNREEVHKNINGYLHLWRDLDEETKLFNYIEFRMYLPKVKKWNVRFSNSLLSDKEKYDKVYNVAKLLNQGSSVWHKMSKNTIMSYINLPKTLKERSRTSKKLEGKDLLANMFNIHHFRFNDKPSNTKVGLFDQDVYFVDTHSDESVYVMFDERFSIAYFLDIFCHEDLYKYKKLLQSIRNSGFPLPYMTMPLLTPPEPEHDLTDDEIKGLLCKGASVIFAINHDNSRICVTAINEMRTSGFTSKVTAIYNHCIKGIEETLILPCDFLYPGQIFNEFMAIS